MNGLEDGSGGVTSELTRREVLGGAGSVAVLAMLSGCGSTARPEGGSYGVAPDWMKVLARSATGGRDYVPEVQGRIPVDLAGSVYRNGPGLFEVGDSRVANLLDGDGLVQRLSFEDGAVRYQNAFVRTEKFVAEQAAGKRLHSTWSVRRGGGFLSNLGGGHIESQAGVTVYPIHGRILARDEIGPSYIIDPDTLDTLGHVGIGEDLDVGRISFKAHCKLDPDTGEVIYLGTRFGRRLTIHVVVEKPDFAVRTQFSFVAPRQVYFHDFAVSRTSVVFIMQPCFLNVYPFITGMSSLIGAMKWKPDQANLIGVVRRSGGDPVYIEAPACFIWHTLNAYDKGNRIIVDVVGYDQPDHFIGNEPLFANLMHGRLGESAYAGRLLRYIIDPVGKTASVETIDDTSSEFPIVDPRNVMSEHRYGYVADAADGHTVFQDGVARIDYRGGIREGYRFTGGEQAVVGEPVFVPRPGSARRDQGWIVTQCLDRRTLRAFFAVFEARSIGDGPVARIWLSHHLPISFHGWWSA